MKIWVEFFKVYDSFGKLKSPILYGKAIIEGDLKVVPLREEATEEIPQIIKTLVKDEKAVKKFPFLEKINPEELIRIPDNNIYGVMIKNWEN